MRKEMTAQSGHRKDWVREVGAGGFTEVSPCIAAEAAEPGVRRTETANKKVLATVSPAAL